MANTKANPDSVDDYLANIPERMAPALRALRQQIRASAPEAQEVIRMGTPTYLLNGNLVSFAAAAKHCALYVMSSGPVKAHAGELSAFDTAPTAIRFQPDRPIPETLVAAIVRERVEENSRRKK